MNDQELLAAYDELIQRDVPDAVLHGRPATEAEAKSDPGHVPGWLIPRLARYAAHLGYPVNHTRELYGTELGRTDAAYSVVSYHPIDIKLQAGMSPASTARVLCHELSHAQMQSEVFGDDRTRVRFCYAVAAGKGGQDDDLEEIAAEASAALCSRVLRISDEYQFSPWYLVNYSWKRPHLLHQARGEAVRRAGIILKAIA